MLSQKAKLVLLNRKQPQEIPLGQELTIGRGYSNLLRLDGEEISRVHAIIYRRDDDYFIRDLDSKNGIFLNGAKASVVKLHPGDRVQIGKFQMVFDPPAGFAPTPVPRSDSQAPVTADNGSSGGAQFGDDEFARSQMFSAPVMPGRTPPPPPPPVQDEVTFFSREELSRELSNASSDTQDAEAIEAETMRFLLDFASRDSAENAGLTDYLLAALARAVDASRGVVILHGPQDGAFSPVAIFPERNDVAVNRVVMREGFSQGRGILCPALRDCGLFRDSTTVSRDRISTLISVPLRGFDGETGLLYLDRCDEAEPFGIAHILAAARVARVLELQLFQSFSHATPTSGSYG